MARLLLDTHVVLWSLSAPDRLAPPARDAIADPRNAVLVSAASVWEVAIKSALGKLSMPDDLAAQLRHARFDPLAITHGHAEAVGLLPRLHCDPFDRMLVAQAQVEGLTLVTRDAYVRRYDVPTLAA